MRYLVILGLVSQLQGCFFFFWVPSSLWEGGNACAGESAYVGQNLKMPDGRMAKIEKVVGRHQRCQTSVHPILVDVSYDEGKSNVQEWERK